MIIDRRSSESIMSKSLVKALSLQTMKHPRPYSIGWIKKSNETKVIELFKLPFSIVKWYLDELIYDIVDMDACHILLGRPW